MIASHAWQWSWEQLPLHRYQARSASHSLLAAIVYLPVVAESVGELRAMWPPQPSVKVWAIQLHAHSLE